MSEDDTEIINNVRVRIKRNPIETQISGHKNARNARQHRYFHFKSLDTDIYIYISVIIFKRSQA